MVVKIYHINISFQNTSKVSDVQNSRFLDLQIYKFQNNNLNNYRFEISKKHNKGVLWRPWTKWKILKIISSTLTFPKTCILSYFIVW